MQEFKFLYDKPSTFTSPGELSNKYNSTPHENPTPLLFTPFTIKNVTLKNRIVVSPMCQYSSEDGFMNDWHLVHLGTFAKGGAGLVIFEASAVQENGRISYADSGIWKDAQIEPLKRINNFIHLHGSKTAIQIAHAGRKASTTPPFLENSRNAIPSNDSKGHGWETVGASPIKWGNITGSSDPHELSIEEIQNVIKSFGEATIRAKEAGFDIIEIHGAHGYLIDQFLSPTSNQRTDIYGGSFENRIRFLLEIIKEVRIHWDISKPLFLRLSCEEWVENGWHISDTIKLAKIIQEQGLVDLIDCSSGGNSQSQHITVKPLYQVPFSDQVRNSTHILTSAVGLITNAKEAEQVLQEKKADLIMFAREFLRDPFFPIHAAKDLGVDIDYSLQYMLSKPRN